MSSGRFPGGSYRFRERMFMYIVGGLFLFCLFMVLFGLFVQLLWNATIASMFSLAPISFWQAIGIFILAKLIFGFGAGTTSTVRRRSRSRKRRKEESNDDDVSTLSDDAEFSKFWDEEGREAYKAYRARDVNEDDPPRS